MWLADGVFFCRDMMQCDLITFTNYQAISNKSVYVPSLRSFD